MARRSGLGKGLGALIPTEVDGQVAPGEGSASDLREVAVVAVRPNRFQPRQAFDEDALGSLAASIAEVGVLQPILVRPIGDEDVVTVIRFSQIVHHHAPHVGNGEPPRSN